MPLASDRELQSWQMSMDVIEEIYDLTRSWPSSERYGLVTQTQRAAVSIAANIAEGYGRMHRGEYVPHLSIANGSRCELETLLLIAERVKVVETRATERVQCMVAQLGRLLTKQIRSLQTNR